MKRKQTLLILAALSLMPGCKQQAPPPELQPRPVRVVVVAPQDISPRDQLTGEIRPRTETDLGFRTDGKMIARLVDTGAAVRKDDVLARLDGDDARNRFSGAQSALESAVAELKQAQPEEARQRELLARGVSTQAKYDTALRGLRSAQARVEAAQADLRVARDRVDYTELRADFDGIVTAVGPDPGRVVSAGQMIIRLARPDEKDAVVAVPEKMFIEYPEAPPVEVSLATAPEIRTMGTVREIAPKADPVTRTFIAKISLPNAPVEMRLGSVVVARAILPERPALVLPAGALFGSGSEPAVWVVDPDTSTVSLRPVKVLRYDSGRVVLASGVGKGDVVVTAGINTLRPGQKVRLLSGSPQNGGVAP